MKKLFNKKWTVFALSSILLQTVLSCFSPLVVNAADITHPDEVTIEYPAEKFYTFTGKSADGSAFETNGAPLTAVSGNNRFPVFCIEPGVPINGPSSPGFGKNPLPSMPEKAKLISALWQDAGTDDATRMVAQSMIWEEVNKLQINKILIGGTQQSLDKIGIGNQINQAISDYQKKPSFHDGTTQLVLGKSTTLTDTNGAKLADFDRVVKNTAKVNYMVNDNQLIITPTNESKASGELVLEKTKKSGTPIVYRKAGEQTVMVGAIDQTNKYTIKLDIQTEGDLKVVKRDKESGVLVPNTIFTVDFHGARPTAEIKTGEDGSATIKGIFHDTKVTITEKSVPAPYVVDSTPLEAVIKAGETIEVISHNLRAKGQITLDKTGTETGSTPWNEHYSLAGNIFEIRKGSLDGNIVSTITTDEAGHAETSKAQKDALELGTYYVVESKASNGFVNTFAPKKVELAYANQTVPLIIENVKGTNQEVTGTSVLVKRDKDTQETPQGSATFKGAEYTLYHGEDGKTFKKGDPVKWTESFKPEVLEGTHSTTPVAKDAVTLLLNEKNRLGVKHLALGSYFWRETKAPIGYTEDQTNYHFEIVKKDDRVENIVMHHELTAKEQVIRFKFDFFKFANSSSGSASTGYNGLDFKLTPLEGTKEITGAKDTVTTHHDDQSVFDGYGKFEEIPFGDYLLEEVEAPSGFEKIKPLEIHSSFEENKEDYKESSYRFTITEENQKEPIKEVKVPYKELTNQAFSVSLNRLMLYDLPKEKNSLTSLATWADGEKILTDTTQATLTDQLNFKLNELKDEWYVLSQVIDVAATKANQEKNPTAKPVVLAEKATKQKNSEKKGTWDITQELEYGKIKDKTLVLFNYLYSSEKAYQAGEEPIASDTNLDNQAQTVKVAVKNGLTIQTKARLEDGSNTFTHGDLVDMYDDVEITHDLLDGSKEAFETILIAILPSGETKEVWKSDKINYVVNDQKFVQTVVAKQVDTRQYPVGTTFTFKEIHYDEKGTINGKHNDDLQEKNQTLYPKDQPQEPEEPKTPEKPVSPESPTSSTGTYPKTGETASNILLFLGFTLIFAVTVLYFWKHRE